MALEQKPNTLRAEVQLKTGETLKNISLPESYKVDATDLTEKTVHRFVSLSDNRSYFVQGNNVAYLEIKH